MWPVTVLSSSNREADTTTRGHHERIHQHHWRRRHPQGQPRRCRTRPLGGILGTETFPAISAMFLVTPDSAAASSRSDRSAYPRAPTIDGAPCRNRSPPRPSRIVSQEMKPRLRLIPTLPPGSARHGFVNRSGVLVAATYHAMQLTVAAPGNPVWAADPWPPGRPVLLPPSISQRIIPFSFAHRPA